MQCGRVDLKSAVYDTIQLNRSPTWLQKDCSEFGPPLFSSSQGVQVPLSSILPQVQVEAILWGLGTALGELPPYFISRAGFLYLYLFFFSFSYIAIPFSNCFFSSLSDTLIKCYLDKWCLWKHDRKLFEYCFKNDKKMYNFLQQVSRVIKWMWQKNWMLPHQRIMELLQT